MASSTDETVKRSANREARLSSVYEKLQENDLAPYWAVDNDLDDHDEDDQVLRARKALPFIWKYSDIEPLLYEAAELITMDDSERRSIVLVNPDWRPSGQRFQHSIPPTVSTTRVKLCRRTGIPLMPPASV